MNSLKAALGSNDKKNDKVTSNMSVSRKKFSTSKSQSMWALQIQQKNTQISLDNDHKLLLLSNLLKSAFQKDSTLSQAIIDRIVQDFQQELGSSSTSNKSQISSYLVLEDKLTDLIDLQGEGKSEFKGYLQVFHENVEERIAGLRSKDKNSHLRHFDKIADSNSNGRFKKKSDFLDIGGIKLDLAAKSRQKSKDSHNNKSTQKKLTRLFSKQKGLKEKQPTKKHPQDHHDDYLLSESMTQNNESVSYSAIMSSSVAVKQRRPRKKSTKCEDYFMGSRVEDRKNVDNEEELDKTDKAFIFFRPKKNAKN